MTFDAHEVLDGVGHLIAAGHEGVDRGLAVLAVGGLETPGVVANHHLEGAEGHLHADGVEELAVGDVGVGGGRGGVEDAAGDHEAGSLAEVVLGRDEEGGVVGAVRSLGDMVVVDLVSGHKGGAASTRVGGVLVVGIGAGEAGVGETEEGAVVAFLSDDGGVDLCGAHAVTDDEDDVAGMGGTLLFGLLGGKEERQQSEE